MKDCLHIYIMRKLEPFIPYQSISAQQQNDIKGSSTKKLDYYAPETVFQ